MGSCLFEAFTERRGRACFGGFFGRGWNAQEVKPQSGGKTEGYVPGYGCITGSTNGEESGPFYFNRSGHPWMGAPVSDVYRMDSPATDPTEGIVPDEPPGLSVEDGTASIGGVGCPRSRSEPEVVVEFQWGIGRFRRTAGPAGWCPHLDGKKFTEQAITDEFTGQTELMHGTLLGAELKDPTGPVNHRAEDLILLHAARHRFFHVHVFAVFHRCDGNRHVPVIRRSDKDRVDVLPLEELAKVMIGPAIVIVVMAVDQVFGFLALVAVDVADCEDLSLGQGQCRTE